MTKTMDVVLSEDEIITLKKMANLVTDLAQTKADAGECALVIENPEFKEIGQYVMEELQKLL